MMLVSRIWTAEQLLWGIAIWAISGLSPSFIGCGRFFLIVRIMLEERNMPNQQR
jgi:hypothetical protein